MHTLTIKAQIDLGVNATPIVPGQYVVEDVNGAQLLLLADGGMMVPYQHVRSVTRDAAVPPKKILVTRVGGFGDLVLLTPILRALKAKYPSAMLHVCSMKHYSPVLEGLWYVDDAIEYPMTRDCVDQYDEVFFLESAIERNPLAEKMHATEVFAAMCGIDFDEIESLKPDYQLTDTERVWATEFFPAHPKRVGIQVGTSALCRTYPRKELGEVVAKLLQDGWEVLLLGAKGEIQLGNGAPNGLRNLAEMDLTFRQSAAVLTRCTGFIGSDSALLHVAGALSVPAVGLYGPFPWNLRTAHSPSIFGLQGRGDCAPCFHHVNGYRKNHFPDHCPSRSKGYCEVLASIKPDAVVAKLNQIIAK